MRINLDHASQGGGGANTALTERHRGLLSEADKLVKANQAIFAKGHDAIKSEDVDSLESNNARIDEIKGLIDGEVKVARRIASAQGRLTELDSYLNKADANSTFAGQVQSPVTSHDGSFKAVGFMPSGSVVIGDDGTIELDESGDSTIPFKAWKAAKTGEYKHAFGRYLKVGLNNLTRDEIKNLEEGLDPQGGYLVPAEILNMIVTKKPTPTRVAGMVTTVQTSRDAITMPKVNYTTATDDASGILYSTPFRVTWTGENPSSDTAARVTDTNIFGNKRIGVNTAMITGIITRDMAEDAAFPVQNWMADKFGETVDLLKDYCILQGSGKNQPMGILTRVASAEDMATIKYVPSGNASAVDPDGLISLMADVPEQYDDNCRFVFNKVSTWKAIRQLKDLNDRYLFGSGVATESGLSYSTPRTLLDYPYAFSGFMPNIAANAYPIIFGDLKGYYFVQRIGFSVEILRERYAERNQIAVLGRVRFGGEVIEPWRLRVQKISVS